MEAPFLHHVKSLVSDMSYHAKCLEENMKRVDALIALKLLSETDEEVQVRMRRKRKTDVERLEDDNQRFGEWKRYK